MVRIHPELSEDPGRTEAHSDANRLCSAQPVPHRGAQSGPKQGNSVALKTHGGPEVSRTHPAPVCLQLHQGAPAAYWLGQRRRAS